MIASLCPGLSSPLPELPGLFEKLPLMAPTLCFSMCSDDLPYSLGLKHYDSLDASRPPMDRGALFDEITVGWNRCACSTLRHVSAKCDCALQNAPHKDVRSAIVSVWYYESVAFIDTVVDVNRLKARK
jgi:hypothetical protein